jgi:predicted flap endonuclease-1-like 5' DNA nuclease
VAVTPAPPAPVVQAAKPVRARESPAPKLPRELPVGAPLARRDKVLPACPLSEDAPVVQAPAIGPKTAKRLEAIGVRTVTDLLRLNPERAQADIGVRHITAQTVRDWQAQARLACTVPGLKSREAQALAACGVGDARDLVSRDAEDLCEAIGEWGISDAGPRAWGNAPAPTADDVATWMLRARRALPPESEAREEPREVVAA